MASKTPSDILDELYQVNKTLRQIERWYGTTSQSGYYMYKHGFPEVEQWPEGFMKWATLYETKLEREATLLALSREQLLQLRVAAKNKQPIALHSQEILPISIAFLIYWGNKVTWLEEIGPFVVEGPWLAEDEPWQEKAQWPESKGHWYFFVGDQLLFTSHTREEFIAFVYGMAFSLLALPDELFEQVKPPVDL